MLTAAILLSIIGLLGAFDIAWFHHHTCRLSQRKQSHLEVWIHIVRGVVYTLQFAVVSGVRLAGMWYAALAVLLVVDAVVAIADVAVEPDSRRDQGGLPRGEYINHIVLSVLAGAYLHALITASLPWAGLPTGVSIASDLPVLLQWSLRIMAVGCLATTGLELLILLDETLPAAGPVHVRTRLACSLEALWTYTQDHRRHPGWDHRFSRIDMLDEHIRQGTCMRYEKDVLGLTIRGFGRYKHHRPMRQSTFEFWSEDRRSIIERGVGLWLYRPLEDGRIEFSTAYTYTVRWGLAGRWIDRLLFRPLIRWETARSFARLARLLVPGASTPVVSAIGRHPTLEPVCSGGYDTRAFSHEGRQDVDDSGREGVAGRAHLGSAA